MPEQGSTSVVIPFFNDADVISRTLDSIREQSCLPREVLISDDLSSQDQWDKLIAICSKYPELRIRCLRGEVNTGPGLARARAISQAVGTYVAFCDADD